MKAAGKKQQQQQQQHRCGRRPTGRSADASSRRRALAGAAFLAAAAVARLEWRQMGLAAHPSFGAGTRPRAGGAGANASATYAAAAPDDDAATFGARMDGLFFSNASAARRACGELDRWGAALDHLDRGSSRLFFDCMDALGRAQKRVGPAACSSPIRFHLFWAAGPLRDAAELSVRSVLHSQPPGCFRVSVWTPDEETRRAVSDRLLSEPRHAARRGSHLEVQALNSTDLLLRIQANFPDIADAVSAAGPILESWGGAGGADSPVQLSDAVRFFLLAAHGGIYLDADNLVLRSLQPLAGRDFAYAWAFEGFANTAVLGLRLKSPSAKALLENVLGSATSAEDLNQRLHPQNLTSLVRQLDAGVDILPSAYFDAVWVINDGYNTPKKEMEERYGISTFEDLFDRKLPRPVRREDFLPGCFVYHWHNQWGKSIANGTVAKIFLDYYDAREAAGGTA